MKRIIVVAVLAAIAALAYVLTAPVESSVSVTDARAVPTGADSDIFMVSLTMKNDGAPVALTGVSSPSDAKVSIMKPQHSGLPTILPGNGEGQFAMDGAHIMLSVPNAEFAEGAFLPLTLIFDDGSEVATRVMRMGMGGMQHGQMNAVEVETPPSVEIIAPNAISADGFEVLLSVENFEFLVAADDAAHVPNQGHAHIYLNGLKLGRLYEEAFTIGALKPGAYTLRIGLNTNDHRPYAANGITVEAQYSFDIP